MGEEHTENEGSKNEKKLVKEEGEAGPSSKDSVRSRDSNASRSSGGEKEEEEPERDKKTGHVPQYVEIYNESLGIWTTVDISPEGTARSNRNAVRVFKAGGVLAVLIVCFFIGLGLYLRFTLVNSSWFNIYDEGGMWIFRQELFEDKFFVQNYNASDNGFEAGSTLFLFGGDFTQMQIRVRDGARIVQDCFFMPTDALQVLRIDLDFWRYIAELRKTMERGLHQFSYKETFELYAEVAEVYDFNDCPSTFPGQRYMLYSRSKVDTGLFSHSPIYEQTFVTSFMLDYETDSLDEAIFGTIIIYPKL